MSIISLENVTRQFRAEPLLDGIKLGIERGEKVGIIGVNGCGKSTLLRIIAGQETIDAGRVVIARGTTIGYLAQNPVFDETLTVLDAVFAASTEIMALLQEYERACQVLTDNPAALAPVAELASQLEASGGWELETNARTVLNHLGVVDTTAIVETMSGGMRKRVALAHALIVRPDLLMLDEPTNHLDTDAIQWLERWLAEYSGTLMLVTHDRYFLDRVTNRTFEIDRGQIQSFVGNYTSYLERKQEQEAMHIASGEKRDNLIRRELEWLKRGPRARATKQKAHLERARELVEAPREEAATHLNMNVAGRRLGSKTIELRHVSKAYDGRSIVSDFTYTLKRGDRVGIIGPNGCGKTTLLEMFAGRLEPDSGQVDTGSTVAIGYFAQTPPFGEGGCGDQASHVLGHRVATESLASMDDMRVIDYVRKEADVIHMADGRTVTASQLCERFLFPGPLQQTLIGRLSGGEKRRLHLLSVLMENPNILLLDEPTNDLDIPTLVRLEDFLEGFGGCLVVASHDRYFLDRTVESIFRFGEGGRLQEYAGNFSDSEEARERDRKAPPRPSAKGKNGSKRAQARPTRGGDTASAKSARGHDAALAQPAQSGGAAPAARSRKMSMRERLEMQSLEAELENGETRRKEIEALLAADSSDFARTQTLYTELQTLGPRLDQALERWAELSELPQ